MSDAIYRMFCEELFICSRQSPVLLLYGIYMIDSIAHFHENLKTKSSSLRGKHRNIEKNFQLFCFLHA
jgi:hypothetical protein